MRGKLRHGPLGRGRGKGRETVRIALVKSIEVECNRRRRPKTGISVSRGKQLYLLKELTCHVDISAIS